MTLGEHSSGEGAEGGRGRLTVLGLSAFGASLTVVIVGGLQTDEWLGLPPLLPGPAGSMAGGTLLAAGAVLCGWCVLWFRRARGTPVPMNPPQELIVIGPYAWVRNPMLTGVFGMLLGLGLVLHSAGLALIWTPAYALVHLAELRWIEEPDLEQRFGEPYARYRKQVPMFIPRPGRRQNATRER